MASPIVVLLLICYLYLLQVLFGCRGCVYLPYQPLRCVDWYTSLLCYANDVAEIFMCSGILNFNTPLAHQHQQFSSTTRSTYILFLSKLPQE